MKNKLQCKCSKKRVVYYTTKSDFVRNFLTRKENTDWYTKIHLYNHSILSITMRKQTLGISLATTVVAAFSVMVLLAATVEEARADPNTSNEHTHSNCNQGKGNDKCNFGFVFVENDPLDHLNCNKGRDTCNFHDRK
jgi:hypothetical protein